MKVRDLSYVRRNTTPPSSKQQYHFVVHAPGCRYFDKGDPLSEYIDNHGIEAVARRAAIGILAPCKVCKPPVLELARAEKKRLETREAKALVRRGSAPMPVVVPRGAVAPQEMATRRPPTPDVLAGALEEPIHKDLGRVVRTVKVPKKRNG